MATRKRFGGGGGMGAYAGMDDAGLLGGDDFGGGDGFGVGNDVRDIGDILGGGSGDGSKVTVKPPAGEPPDDGLIRGEDRPGSTDTARDRTPPSGSPLVPFGLPQGVTVNDQFTEPASAGSWRPAQPAPAQSIEPAPFSAETGIPPTVAGPQRRSVPNPAIYGESRGSQLFGNAGGLLGGGIGAVGGSEPSGPLTPTEMFSRLLQLFREQG